MSVPSEPPPDPAPQRRLGHPWERPDTEFPGVVQVGTLQFRTTGPTAVAVTGLLAYSNGFEFFVTRLLRPDDPGSSAGRETRPPNPGMPRISRESFRIGVEFAGGGQAFTGGFVEMSYEDEPGRPFLYPGGTVTRGHREDGRWWVWPLPPPGQLDFICQLGEAETRVYELITERAGKSLILTRRPGDWSNTALHDRRDGGVAAPGAACSVTVPAEAEHQRQTTRTNEQ